MRKLIIDRQTWLRGAEAEGGHDSFLLRSRDGKRCCIGFYGNQIAGKTDAEMADVQGPQLCSVGEEWGQLVRVTDMTSPLRKNAEQSATCRHLVNINDDIDRTEPDRERAITAHFHSIGVEVEFIN